ncbi:MAG: restriction endonuclease subunit S, partial [Spirochaetales bacterium]|nr:restriction endonuclease subunit S [Spirochaetales bacterium]
VITGTAQPQITVQLLKNLKFPLPPLAEQQRIVAKVDELMAWCDELESLLQTESTTATRFAAAIAQQGAL